MQVSLSERPIRKQVEGLLGKRGAPDWILHSRKPFRGTSTISLSKDPDWKSYTDRMSHCVFSCVIPRS